MYLGIFLDAAFWPSFNAIAGKFSQLVALDISIENFDERMTSGEVCFYDC